MGQPFLRAYLTIHDRENNRIGFVGVPKSQVSSFSAKVLTFILVGCLIALGWVVVVTIIVYKCARSNSKKRDKAQAS